MCQIHLGFWYKCWVCQEAGFHTYTVLDTNVTPNEIDCPCEDRDECLQTRIYYVDAMLPTNCVDSFPYPHIPQEPGIIWHWEHKDCSLTKVFKAAAELATLLDPPYLEFPIEETFCCPGDVAEESVDLENVRWEYAARQDDLEPGTNPEFPWQFIPYTEVQSMVMETAKVTEEYFAGRLDALYRFVVSSGQEYPFEGWQVLMSLFYWHSRIQHFREGGTVDTWDPEAPIPYRPGLFASIGAQ